MEVKKYITALCAAAAVICTAAAAAAADEVIFEYGKAEAGDRSVSLGGWGRELQTRCIYEADVRFGKEGSGFMLCSADDTKTGTTIRAVDRNGKLTLAADGGNGSYIYYIELDTEKWYHIELYGSFGTNTGMIDMNVGIYDDNMNITETKNYYMILMNDMFASSGVGAEHIRIEPGTEVNNVKVTELRPDSIKLEIPSDTVAQGGSVQLTVKAQRNGEALDYPMPVSYVVTGSGITVDENGLITVSDTAPIQTFGISVSGGGFEDSAQMSVVSDDIFTINTAVFNEQGTVLEQINTVKNYFYDDTAVFTVAVYRNGILADVFTKYVPANAIEMKKEVPVVMGYTLPDWFDSDSCVIEIRVRSAGGKCAVPQVSGDIAMRALFEENKGAVEWIDEHKTVAGMLNGKTVFLQIGNTNAYIDGAELALQSAPYIQNDRTYIPAELVQAIAD